MSLMGQLGNLEAAGLVRVAQVEPDLEYLFRHALVQEAAYASLLESDRQQLHLSVGETIEQIYPERLDEFSAILARHFKKAGDDARALNYFIRAADTALASYANKEAEMHFRQALELSCPKCEYASLLAGLGEALYRQTRFEEAIQAWREGVELYKREGDLSGVAHLYSRLARVTWHMGDIPGSVHICEEGINLTREAAESAEIAMLLHETARSYYFSGNSEKTISLCKQALQMASKFGALEVQADTLATYGVLPDLSTDEALEALQKAVEIAKKHGFLAIAGRAYHNLGVLTFNHSNDLSLAYHYFLKAAEMGRQRGVVTEELFSLQVAADVDLTLGRLSDVEETLDRIETFLRKLPDPTAAEMQADELKIKLWWMRGKWKEARELAMSIYQDAQKNGNIHLQLSLGGNIVSALFELHRYGEIGDLSEVETILQEIIQLSEHMNTKKSWLYNQMGILRSRQARFEEAHHFLAKAELADKQHATDWDQNILREASAELAYREGRYDQAKQMYEDVVALYKKKNNNWSLARALMDWAEVCIAKADPADLEQARDLYRQALILFDEMGAHRHKKLVEDRLLKLQEKIYDRVISYQRDAQDLARAAKVQSSFLPEEAPQPLGWQIAVKLHPARQTSGDFYDFIPMVAGQLGILVADVADKGAAAALFMATSQSLIRTYAGEFIDNPELALAATSRRILADTHASLFVTVFYGVLDTESGRLAYCNAGHTPAIYLAAEGKFKTLPRTGPPLGISEESKWERAEIQLNPGDNLVLYSDGVTEAQNSDEKFFGEMGLLSALKLNRGASADQLRDAVLNEVHHFVGKAPQFDDITLLILQRLVVA